ncbi:MAG: NAD(P)H-dependent oxidoreductase [Oscillibacter sp.]
MSCLTVLCPGEQLSVRCAGALDAALCGQTVRRVTCLSPDAPLENCRILFVLSLPESGVNPAVYELLALLRTTPGFLEGSTAGILVDGAGTLHTKAVARELVLAANGAGCAFVGRPLVEAAGALQNFTVQAHNAHCDLEQAYHLAAADLAARVLAFTPPKKKRPQILVLHASNHKTSNTLAMWSAVRRRLEADCDISEIGLRNGTLEDCSGCPYTMCLHYGERGDCFYGGVMVREVYPAIREADGVVVLCPNYNDALSANLTACINRLTALYRTTDFSGKALFALVVSGYSGGDIVAAQLVSALNMNKGFWLPPHFCLLETANDAGAAMALPGIETTLAQFGENVLCQLKQ